MKGCHLQEKRNRAEKQITPTKQAKPTTTPAPSPPKQRSPNQQNVNRPRQPVPEPRRELRLQTDMAIQRLGESEKDHPPTHKELFLFFQEMNKWECLDERLVTMQEIQAESVGWRKMMCL
ncbi:Hypothetical predicted protein [Paramuricea clavata]|uniref:Uncharacterized protein n=1 Tax=Paramuricea clavata TaxID=317549 RepID=A0A6S7HIR8_PARCT|nr:Hypothetical predicted protein [Paramuricea clavata]